MKNIFSTAIIAVTVLSMAACDLPNKKQKPDDSTSTTTRIDSTTKTTASIDSTGNDTTKMVADQKTGGKTTGNNGSASLRAVKDSFKKDSAKLSKK